MKLRISLILLLSGAYMQPALGYDPDTHTKLSMHALKHSVLASSQKLKDLGLKGVQVSNSSQTFYDHDRENKWTVLELVQHGAWYEDERAATQALHHFFNPLNGQALTVGGITPGVPSPDWALKDQFNPFSYRKARQYFYWALTKSSKSDRENYWGSTFQTMGHIIHHIQDMAQPQHVRNDIHCDKPICQLIGIPYHVTGYEQWTRDNPPADAWFNNYGNLDLNIFNTPRKFWTTTEGDGTGGMGIAEYANRGFFSAGTLTSPDFSLPVINPGFTSKWDVATLCADSIQNGRPPKDCEGIKGVMYFEGNTVFDTLRPNETYDNLRARSYSVFDQDLKNKGKGAVYALNRFNFDEAQKFLLPRAVSYSAGLIDYFFRGNIDMAPDPENPGKYIVKNLSNEKMNGTFALYYDDKDGERHQTPNKWEMAIEGKQSSRSLTLKPSDTGKPASEVPGQYMLVFNGGMGKEDAGPDTPATGAIAAKLVQDPLMMKLVQASFTYQSPNIFNPIPTYYLNAKVSAPNLRPVITAALAAKKNFKVNINEQMLDCSGFGKEALICWSNVYPFTEFQMDLSGASSNVGPYFFLSSLITPTGTVSLLVDDAPLFRFTFLPHSITLNPPIRFSDTFHVDASSVVYGRLW